MTSLNREILELARLFKAELDLVKRPFVGRDEVVEVLGIAALCREHVLVIGPPGTAKTRLVEDFCQMLATRPFIYLLTRFTEPAEIFGPIDVKRFQDESVYEINTMGMLPEARVAFLDEVFQGSSAILNTLLTLINERTFRDGRDSGGSGKETPLEILIGSSNVIPDDEALAAFSDRFLLRCNLDYVTDEEMERVLELGWQAECRRIRSRSPQTSGLAADRVDRTRAPFPLADLWKLQQAVADVDVTGILDPYLQILRSIRAAGIKFSDRRSVRAQKVFAASALLAGRSEPDITDLARLANLWTESRDDESMRRIVTEYGIPIADAGARVRELQEILEVDLNDIVVRRDQVLSEHDMKKLMRETSRLAAEVRRDYPRDAEALKRIQRVQQDNIDLFRERFRWEDGTDV
jgi:MoxR-like ATPase